MVGGLTYNFLPFMILPIYVSLEKIDRRLVEAAEDLYSTPLGAFRKVVCRSRCPGCSPGSLLTFIPATGDFINAQLLGSPNQQMIGTVIQNQFLEVRDYPLAASLSFVLMAVITLGVLAYARVLGTEDAGLMRRLGTLADGRRRLAGARLPVPADLRDRLYSFNKPAGKFNFVWKAFSLDAWRNPFATGRCTSR